jgi:hypothetical protein
MLGVWTGRFRRYLKIYDNDDGDDSDDDDVNDDADINDKADDDQLARRMLQYPRRNINQDAVCSHAMGRLR